MSVESGDNSSVWLSGGFWEVVSCAICVFKSSRPSNSLASRFACCVILCKTKALFLVRDYNWQLGIHLHVKNLKTNGHGACMCTYCLA